MHPNIFFKRVFKKWTIFLSLYWTCYNSASVFYVFCFTGGTGSMWDLSSPTSDWACTPCTGRGRLNHWTTREGPHPQHLPRSLTSELSLGPQIRRWRCSRGCGRCFQSYCPVITLRLSIGLIITSSSDWKQSPFPFLDGKKFPWWSTGIREWSHGSVLKTSVFSLCLPSSSCLRVNI